MNRTDQAHMIDLDASPDIYVVGADIIGTEAIARSLCSSALKAKRAGAMETTDAVDRGRARAVVLVAGPGLDAMSLLASLRRHPATVFIVVAATNVAPPLASDLRPIVVTTLDDLVKAVSAHVRTMAPSSRGLTERHVEILQQLAKGSTPAQAADELGITVKTLNNHLGVVYRRLGTRNVTQAVLTALRQGLIRLP